MALAEYEAARRPQVTRIQDAARPSLSWWEHFGRSYRSLPPWQFAFHFFSRSLPESKIRQRDAQFVESVREAWRAAHGGMAVEPLWTPIDIAGVPQPTAWSRSRMARLSWPPARCRCCPGRRAAWPLGCVDQRPGHRDMHRSGGGGGGPGARGGRLPGGRRRRHAPDPAPGLRGRPAGAGRGDHAGRRRQVPRTRPAPPCSPAGPTSLRNQGWEKNIIRARRRAMITPVADGTVPWPEELAREYTKAGWWRGQALGTEIAAVADARTAATALVDGATRISYASLAGPGRRAGQPAHRRARPAARRPDRGPAAELLAVRRAHPGLPARRDRAGHGAARAPPARAGLPVRAQRSPGPGRPRRAARLRPPGTWPSSCGPGRPRCGTSWWPARTCTQATRT